MKNKLWQYILVLLIMFSAIYIIGTEFIWGVNPKTIRNLSDFSETEKFVSTTYEVSKDMFFTGNQLKLLVIIEDKQNIEKIKNKLCIVEMLDKEDKLINSFELYDYKNFYIIRMRGVYYLINEDNKEKPF